MTGMRRWGGVAGITVLLMGVSVTRVAADEAPQDLKRLSISELMEVQVTSVAKKPQKRDETAAAVTVLTQEDIRRSGATTLVELLRLVPGVHVGRISSDDWAVGIRGFSSRLSRSMLVLIDGRSVYTPLFAGVYWQIQDTLLEDVERVEVIRGPGGTLWGANAVNGVVNVITKSAADTHGELVTAGGGSEERVFGGARHGGQVGDLHYRVYGKAFDRDAGFSRDAPNFDAWRMGQAGARMDWTPPGSDKATLQGDYYYGDLGARGVGTVLDPPGFELHDKDVDVAGGNVLGRWTHAFGGGSEATLQAYYDRTNRRDLEFAEGRDTGDVDFQHRFAMGPHEVVWGLGYRVTSGAVDSAEDIEITPRRRTNHLVSGFLQDEWTLFDDRVRLIAGSKLEWNDYSGVEVQPTGRLLWLPAPRHVLWAAVSRAVRTPSRVEQDLAITALVDPATPTFARVVGDGRFKSETLIAYELGYRWRARDDLSFDVAAFYSDYENLLSAETGQPFVDTTPDGPRTIVPLALRNRLDGDVYGVELTADARPLPWWRLTATYTYLEVDLSREPGSNDVTQNAVQGSSPHHQAALRAMVDLPYGFELDGFLRYVDNLPAQRVGSYVELDLRVGWHVTPNLELAAVAQNLLAPHHAEFANGRLDPVEIQRGAYGKVTWRW
jgi:iron complex outermembrane receptor protein